MVASKLQKSYTASLNDIPSLAQEIARKLKGGEIFALIGNLGAGKTTFTKALAKELKVKTAVTSPTFVLMNRYLAKLPSYSKEKHAEVHIYHLDLYRTRGFTEAKTLGLEEFWGKPDTITLIEWADKIKKQLPKQTIYIYFK